MESEIYINGRFLTQKITGVQRFAYELSRKLTSMFNKVTFIVPGEALQNSDYGIDGFNIEYTGKHSGHLWEQYDLPQLLRKKNNPLLLNFCSTAPLNYTNQLVTIHDLAFRHGKWHSFTFRAFYNFLIPKIAKKSRHVITVSEYSKDDIIRSYNLNNDKVSVVPGAVFDESGMIPGAGIEMYREHLKSQKYILSVGSIDPRKNIKRIIYAFLEAETADLKLFLIGAYNKNFRKDRELENLISTNKERVFFLGYKSDEELKALYENAQLFVYPSLFEGFGLPPIEAMASGCPTLVSNCTSLPEVCGDAALYCNPHSVSDIKNQINTALFDDSVRGSLQTKGPVQAQKFSYLKSAEKLSQILENMPPL